ncbi:MAG: adenylosuccinate synthase [Candidatus Aenigmarchaeota archaeon]|nr:adenylosuccinate synthase [Candidatus Aenigmarchaeota archaeon]
MPGIVIVGAQFGDEGKGKIVDYLSQDADSIVRYQGGANAGHTVVTGNKKFKLHLIPSGAIWGKKCYIGNGVVFDPEEFLEELDTLKKDGITPNISISPLCHVIFDFHKAMDAAEESARKVGTTKKGIGPAYADKISRHGIRMCDFIDDERLMKRLAMEVERKRESLKLYNSEYNDTADSVFKKYSGIAKKIKPFVHHIIGDLNTQLDEGKKVIFEGAQGSLLDVDFGTYPYVTSSSSCSGGACTGTGVPPMKITKCIGIAKAYCTRVGEGPFPTEIHGKTGELIRERGAEYGTTTGRPRRVGWFDAPMVRYSSLVNGFKEIALMKADVLGGMGKIKVCIEYETSEGKVKRFSSATAETAKPIYEEVEGWENPGDWKNAAKKGFQSLPRGLREFVDYIEALIGCKISMLSVGPSREETLVR